MLRKCYTEPQDWTDIFLKENETAGHLAGIGRSVYRDWEEKHEKIDNLEELGVDGKTILK